MSANTELRATAMGLAFCEAAVKAGPRAEKAVSRLLRVTGKNPTAGLVKERSWNANVSFRTAQQLKKQGAL